MAQMHFVYDRKNGNSQQPQRQYAELYSESTLPRHTFFASYHQRLCYDGKFKKQIADCTLKNGQLEQAFLELISPRASTRKLDDRLINITL